MYKTIKVKFCNLHGKFWVIKQNFNLSTFKLSIRRNQAVLDNTFNKYDVGVIRINYNDTFFIQG